MLDRRTLLRNLLAAGAGLTLVPRFAWPQSSAPLVVDPRDPWASLSDLLARITPPRIPRRDFVITKYRTIQHAIDAAHRTGGGRVVVPEGDFLTGPVHLKSRVELHL